MNTSWIDAKNSCRIGVSLMTVIMDVGTRTPCIKRRKDIQ